MSDLWIFVIGLFVTAVTLGSVVIIGLAEASDPAHSRPEDLTEFERNWTNREDVRELEEQKVA